MEKPLQFSRSDAIGIYYEPKPSHATSTANRKILYSFGWRDGMGATRATCTYVNGKRFAKTNVQQINYRISAAGCAPHRFEYRCAKCMRTVLFGREQPGIEQPKKRISFVVHLPRSERRDRNFQYFNILCVCVRGELSRRSCTAAAAGEQLINS